MESSQRSYSFRTVVYDIWWLAASELCPKHARLTARIRTMWQNWHMMMMVVPCPLCPHITKWARRSKEHKYLLLFHVTRSKQEAMLAASFVAWGPCIMAGYACCKLRCMRPMHHGWLLLLVFGIKLAAKYAFGSMMLCGFLGGVLIRRSKDHEY